MSRDTRYELLERVGQGSFATVYRARDKELGREVAIKQIHEQYLRQPEQTARYWHEAQLLASLQHPNIVTFYDIDRERGWLIMELMQGNLAERIRQEPLDLTSVRTTLAHTLRALKYLHARGIVHGDVKPSNLMVDARKRIKIGDFGLARRVSDEDGSLLKGTTKYMAPETVSDEYGDVGPASDLYSLGFSAYELMCGPNFESLFPGLSAFGRDKQIAWMMWHAARDRRLPEVHRVLQGVPDDLATVVNKLCEKDPAKRYQSADEALSDLNIDVKIIKTGGDDNLPAQPDKKKRAIAIAAFSLSALMSIGMLFMPSGEKPKDKSVEVTMPEQGILRHVIVEENMIVVETGGEGIPTEIKLGSSPKILLNETAYITPRELKPGDRLVIKRSKDEEGRSRMEIAVARPDESTGDVTELQPGIGQLSIAQTSGAQRGLLTLRTDGRTEITINGDPARLDELGKDDRVVVQHIPDAKLVGARVATRIEALQRRKLDGFLRDVTPSEVTIEVQRQAKAELVKLDAAKECEVTINGKKIVEGKLLKVADLRAGDRVTLTHHREVVEVHALRLSLLKGSLLDLNLAANSLTINDEKGSRKSFLIENETAVTIDGQPATVTDLRRNDQLQLTYDSAAEQVKVSVVDAVRPVHDNRFAIVIANQAYDDNTLSKLPHAVADGQLVQSTLMNRYACSPEHTLFLSDETSVRITQALPDWLKKTNAQSELIVYLVGHAYVDDQGQPYYAAKDFSLSRLRESGISLSWLREQLEQCPAGEKLLLLDCSHLGEGQDLKQQPASATLLEAVKPKTDPGVFRKTFAIASCRTDQRGLFLTERKHGAFGWHVAQAYSGKGDKNRDVHLEPTELFDHLKGQMAEIQLTPKGGRMPLTQTPVLFVPDDTPPPKSRISPQGKDAVQKLLANNWSLTKFTPAIDGALASQLLQASQILGDEPEAKLAYAVVRLKVRNDDKEAIKYFEQVKLSHPDRRLSYEALAWQHSYSGRYRDAINELTRLCTKLKSPDPEMPGLDAAAKRALEFAGRLRDFAVLIGDEPRRPDAAVLKALDTEVAALGDEARAAFEAGRQAVKDKQAEFEQKIAAKPNSPEATLLSLEQKRLPHYAKFDLDEARKSIVADLEK